MSRWTATRLAQHTTALLRDARLILVSNRAPYINVQVCFWNLGGLFEFQAAFFTVAPKQP